MNNMNRKRYKRKFVCTERCLKNAIRHLAEVEVAYNEQHPFIASLIRHNIDRIYESLKDSRYINSKI